MVACPQIIIIVNGFIILRLDGSLEDEVNTGCLVDSLMLTVLYLLVIRINLHLYIVLFQIFIVVRKSVTSS